MNNLVQTNKKVKTLQPQWWLALGLRLVRSPLPRRYA